MTMAMPPFAAFPAAYPFAAGLGGGIYPPRGGSGLNGGGWQWNVPGGPGGHAVNGGWAGDASWPQRGPVPWMAAGAEVWGHPRSGGNNFNWDVGGRAPNGNGNLG